MLQEKILEALFENQDTGYRDFQSKLIPTVDKDSIIGVRTPKLRELAKEFAKDREAEEFLNTLPHKYFDENQLHAFIISLDKDYAHCIEAVDRFLPYVDNWATCDQLSPKIFRKHRSELIDRIKQWISTDSTYSVRFAVGMLMEHFLNEDFRPEYPELVSTIRSDEYYVNMMIAWYFATGLAKQYESILPFITEKRLDPWTHNKAIQKATESRRITAEQKEFLRQHRIVDKKSNSTSHQCGKP